MKRRLAEVVRESIDMSYYVVRLECGHFRTLSTMTVKRMPEVLMLECADCKEQEQYDDTAEAFWVACFGRTT